MALPLLLLVAAVSGGMAEDVRATPDLEAETGQSRDEMPTHRRSLTGTWRATDAALESMFERAYAGVEGSSVHGVEGDVFLTLDDAGQATLRYVDVTVSLTTGGVDMPLGIDGGGSLRYVVDHSTITFTGNDLDLTFTVMGLPMPFDEADIPLGAPSEVEWSFESGDEDVLVLQSESSSTQALPGRWERVE